MGAILTIPNGRQGSDMTFRGSLEDGGMAVDWSGMSKIEAWLFSHDQKALSGRCTVSVDPNDTTILICEYSASKTQYLGINSLFIRATYNGRTKTYDRKAINIVERTDEVAGSVVLDDPIVDVQFTVKDFSSSILDDILAACIKATEDARRIADVHVGPPGPAGVDEVEVSVGEEAGTPSAESTLEDGKLTIRFDGLKGPEGARGPAGVESVVVTVDSSTGGTPSGTATVVNGVLTLALRNMKGDPGQQGNSGYSGAAGELEVVNNRTQGGATAAWSAEQGKLLAQEVGYLGEVVETIEDWM